MCLNKKVLIGAGAVGLAILVLVPRLFAVAVPILVLAACPLSMVLMMRAMRTKGTGTVSGPDAPGVDHEARVAELEEEVGRLRAESGRRRQELQG